MDLLFDIETAATSGGTRASLIDMVQNLHLVVVTKKAVVPTSSQSNILQNAMTGYSTSLQTMHMRHVNYTPNSVYSTMELEATDSLSHFTVNKSTIVPEILNTFGQLLPNITSLIFRDSKFVYDGEHNVSLNLSQINSLENLKLHGVKNLEFKKAQPVYIRIKWSTSDEYACYKSELQEEDMVYNHYSRRKIFAWIKKEERSIHQYNRFRSKNSTVITVECGNGLRAITLYDDLNFNIYEFTSESQQQETINPTTRI